MRSDTVRNARNRMLPVICADCSHHVFVPPFSICISVILRIWDLSSHRADRMRRMVPSVSVAVPSF